jgi:hypothetical protein
MRKLWGNIILTFVYSTTTANSANMHIDSTGQLFRSTSSKRYKTDIDYDGVYGELIYDMKPVSFKAIDGGKTHVGFIAEDLAEVEPRLVMFDEEGRPDAVEYAYITALLVDEMKQLRQELCTYNETFCNVQRNEQAIYDMKTTVYDSTNVSYTTATDTVTGNWFTNLFNW